MTTAAGLRNYILIYVNNHAICARAKIGSYIVRLTLYLLTRKQGFDIIRGGFRGGGGVRPGRVLSPANPMLYSHDSSSMHCKFVTGADVL